MVPRITSVIGHHVHFTDERFDYYMRSTKWVTGFVPGNLMFKIVKQLPYIKFNHVLSLFNG